MTDATPPAVSIRNLSKRFGDTVAVDDVSLDIRAGEFFALLGPSGCGKTTLLRMLAGLAVPDAGTIYVGGRDMRGVPANRRPTNMLFQSYAIFPHMSVLENVAYGLRVAGTGKAEAHRLAEEALGLVALDGFGARPPDALSGGERQRVALARALVKQPKVLLLDEPLSALDAQLRLAMRRELATLQGRLGITFVIVTHDQEEALSMADRIAVMDQGRIRQIAPPAALYERPADRFVAGFIGAVNLLQGEAGAMGAEGVRIVRAPALAHDFRVRDDGKAAPGTRVWLAVRPERIAMTLADSGAEAKTETGEDGNRITGAVEDITYLGAQSVYHVRVAPGAAGLLKVARPNRAGEHIPGIGARVALSWPAEACVLLTR